MIKFVVLVFLFFLSFACFSQARILRGRVVDEANRPIASASITFKGFRTGTWTNREGYYTVTILEKYDTIVCTHTSFNRAAEKIQGNSTINFVMDRIKSSATIILIDTVIENSAIASGANAINQQTENENNFEKVEIKSYFIGGDRALQKYLKQRIFEAIPSTIPKISGNVKYGFTIDPSGVPGNFLLIKGVNKLVDDVVLKVLSNMPKWAPAIQNGIRVEQYGEMEISFNFH
jgi:hypothetical protein